MEQVVVEAYDALDDAFTAAREATDECLRNGGDRDLCGFAWVNVYGVRSNSKLGKVLISKGFRRSDVGKGLTLWNPSGSYTQAITAKERGAEAFAKVLSEKLGIKAYAGSRLD